MWCMKTLFALLCVFCTARSVKEDPCGPYFKDRCNCGTQLYESESLFVVNCTDTGFSDPNVLQHLPKETEVIIFRGNNFSSLPKNVFGEKENVPVNLHTIDLAENKIVDIPGKAFHHVSGVKKLILNHNKIKLSTNGMFDHVHYRVFSNFVNLLELQLINAFQDNFDEDFSGALEEIISNSNFSKLTHLHLDYNHLKSFDDRTFCDIPELKELYLDGNDFPDINFNISCLRHLQKISLKSNNIENLSRKTLTVLDSLPLRGQPLKVDLQCNPWICKSATNLTVTQWITSTKVTLLGTYSCSAGNPKVILKNSNKNKVFNITLGNPGCSAEKLGLFNSNISVMAQILIALTVLVFFVVGAVFFCKGTQIRNKFNPLLDTVSHKMQYTTLRRREEPEVDV